LSSASSNHPFEWYPKEGGLLGKIGARMPGASTYLAGQSLFDFVRGLFNHGGGTTPAAAAPPSFDPNALPPGYAPAPFVPPPWVMPPDDAARTQTSPSNPGGIYGFGPNYVDPIAAGQFIPGLIAWNGPGATNPAAGEGGVYENLGGQGGRHSNIGALAARLGLRGRSASGKWRGHYQ
jgi:hypothetical protein